MPRRLELAGPSFEKDMRTFSSLYSKLGVAIGGKSALGLMIEPKLSENSPPEKKTSRSTPWRILEKNYGIELAEGETSSRIGRSGEIDLIVYANMNLYLIELKALNLECNNAIRYMRGKAPLQCARYAAWVREKEKLHGFLEKHGIKEEQLNAVRIMVCSSGIFKDLEVTCPGTGDHFAVVSEFSLFCTMSGIFSFSLKEPFPLNVGTVSAPLKIINDSVRQVEVVNADREIGQRISSQLIRWIKLITYDRRKEYIEITVSDEETKAFNSLGTGHVINEAYPR